MPATPGRQTVVTLDVPITINQQPSWLQDLSAERIDSGRSFGVTYYKGIGWRVSEYQDELGVIHETSVADNAVVDFTVAPGLFQKPIQRAPSDLTGVNTSRVRSSGDMFWQKLVSAAESWAAAKLSADQAAYPPPSWLSPTIDMDRVAVGNDLHRPDQSIWMRFSVPSIGIKTTDELVRLYFVGTPNSARNAQPGTGQYMLSLRGDGTAVLAQKLVDGSFTSLRSGFRWCPRASVMGNAHAIAIRQDAVFDPAKNEFRGTKIVFAFDHAKISAGNELATIIGIDAGHFVFDCFQVSPTQPQLVPLRLDVRQDVRLEFQVMRSKFRDTGTLITRTQQVPFQVFDTGDANLPIAVTAFGDLPDGTELAINLYCEDTESYCTVTGSDTDDRTYFTKFFTPASDTSRFYAVLTLTSSTDGSASPTITRVSFLRNPIKKRSTPTATVVPTVTAISLSGPEADPSHESLSFTAPDPGGKISLLDRRTPPVAVDVYYDPEDPTKFSRLFMGRIARAKKRIRGPKTTGSTWPVSRWGTYDCTALGMWVDLAEQRSPSRYNFAGQDPSDGKAPYKVTTLIRFLLQEFYLPQQIDVPDLPIRFFAPPGKDVEMIIEPFSDIGPLIVQLCRDYLGGWLVWDSNATNGGGSDDTMGCWRVLIPPTPPYTVLCEFFMGPQASGAGPLDPGSYPDDTSGEHPIKRTGIRKWSCVSYPEPPEGNVVIVRGVAPAPAQGVPGSFDPMCYEQRLVNWKAADFGQSSSPHPEADPTNPDYIDGKPRPIWHADPSLRTQESVNFVARRLYDLSAHARKWVQFEAPLVLVTNPSDSKQIRPRILRYGDIVKIEGELFVVNSVNAKYGMGQGKNQFAAYECFNVPALSDYTTPGDQPGSLDKLFVAMAANIS